MRKFFQSGRLPVAAVFCGSFLLFMIQPLLGRTLLPVFGGSASVWCVCLASYQVLLLAGYLYAHGIAGAPGGGSARRRGGHVAVMAGAALWVWAIAVKRVPLLAWLGGDGEAQTGTVLAGVALFVALPYVTLAAGSTLVQAWMAASEGLACGRSGGRELDGRSHADANVGTVSRPHARNVYSLYAVSNVASLLGLLSYPFLLEPLVPLSMQWYGLAVGMTLYALLMAAIAARQAQGSRSGCSPASDAVCGAQAADEGFAARPPSTTVLWFLLPGVSAFLLNAVTAHLLVDVTPMPLVWVVVLAAFLLSYVIGFSPLGERRRGVWCGAAALALAGAAAARGMWGTGSFLPNAAAGVAMLLCAGVVLHGWLYAERPETGRLTRYYLAIAAGGAVGGLLASLAAPLVFTRVTEYPLALLACAVLVAWRAPKPVWMARVRWGCPAYAAGCGVAWLLLAQVMARHTPSRTVFRARNFYGCLAVTQTFEAFGKNGVLPVFYLWFGQTTHGIQVRSPAFKNKGTAYYGPAGGGIAFYSHPLYQSGTPMKVGVVGLGAGTLACYGRPRDLYRFYEINPQVVRVATDPQLFTYLPDAKMAIDLVPGDARRMLEKERAARDPLYDVLVIDAYSGDAVPYHLTTREAYRLYLDRLEPDGILAVHVSNWHIDLLPLCKAVAAELGVHAYGAISLAEDSVTSGAIWVFMTRQPMMYRYPGKSLVSEVVWSGIRDVPAPSDEKGSLISLLRNPF